MDLKEKTVSAISWLSFTTAMTKLATFATTLVLAGILSPEDFGIIAIASLIVSFVGLFRDIGLGQALIYRKNEIEKAASTAFTMMTVISLLLYTIIFFLSPFISAFFNNPQLTQAIRILTITLVISSLSTVPSVLLEKELDFKRKTIPEAIPFFAYAAISIFLAYNGFGYWSIIFGQIGLETLRSILLWQISPLTPLKFSYDHETAKNLLKYGRHILGSSFTTYAIRNIDDAFVGRLLSTQALGFYNFAYRVTNLPTTQISHVVSKITFPLYSKIESDSLKLKDLYFKTLEYVSMLTFLLSAMIITFGPDFFAIFYGKKWDSAILPLQILAVLGLLRSLSSTMGSVFLATDNVRTMLMVSVIQFILLALFLFPVTTNYGIVGVSVLTVLTLAIAIAIYLKAVEKILVNTYPQYVMIFLKRLLITVLTIPSAKLLLDSLFKDLTVIRFLSEVMITSIFYVLLTVISHKDFRTYIFHRKSSGKHSGLFNRKQTHT